MTTPATFTAPEHRVYVLRGTANVWGGCLGCNRPHISVTVIGLGSAEVRICDKCLKFIKKRLGEIGS